MEALPTAEKFLRATLKASAPLSSLEVEPAPYQGPETAIAYRLLANPDDKKTSDGQVLYSTFVYQVAATEIAPNIGGLVSIQAEIRSSLHFDFDRRGLLPAGVLSCQCDRAFTLPEPTSRGDVRQNLGYIVRLVIAGPAARSLSNPSVIDEEIGGDIGGGGFIGG